MNSISSSYFIRVSFEFILEVLLCVTDYEVFACQTEQHRFMAYSDRTYVGMGWVRGPGLIQCQSIGPI